MKTIILVILSMAPLIVHAQKTILSPQVFYYDPKDTASMKALIRNKSVGSVSFLAIDSTSIPLKSRCEEAESITIKRKTFHMPLKNSSGAK